MNKANITSKGFQFLLQDVNRQLWDLLLNFLLLAEVRWVTHYRPSVCLQLQQEREMDMVEVLGFLFMLGSLELGKVSRSTTARWMMADHEGPQAYSTSNLSRPQIQLLSDLADYGMVYRPQVMRSPVAPVMTCRANVRLSQTSASHFYPTRMATTLTSTAQPLVSADYAEEEKGFLVVETNYRVYAYTSNPLQIAVINLFVGLKTRFPNLIVGSLTRESVKSALNNGITAEQIVTYLATHAHPQMRKQVNPYSPSCSKILKKAHMIRCRTLCCHRQ